MKAGFSPDTIEENIVAIIRAHVEKRNASYVCLVTPRTKLRDLGYLNRSNVEELLIYIKKLNQKLVICFGQELNDLAVINRLTVADLITRVQC